MDDYGLYDSATMPSVSTVPQEFYNEYIEKFAFFSSNACLFYLQTDKAKNDCPTGNFFCDYNEIGADMTLVSKELSYQEALNFCEEQNANLSKYLFILDDFPLIMWYSISLFKHHFHPLKNFLNMQEV